MNFNWEYDDLEPVEEGAPAWVVTFGDMMSLLLTFFVLLFSFSEIDAVRYRALSDAIREAFGVHKAEQMFDTPTAPDSLVTDTGGATGELLNQLQSIIPQAFPGALPDHGEGQGVLLTVPGKLLFESGRDDLNPDVKPQLRKIAELLMVRDNLTLQVEGHTDDVPINTARFRSNWELSAARAIAVIRFLIEECGVPSSRLAAAGYADSRPLVKNDSPENRERNRRVEFKFVEGRM
ncbi:MAG TPA: flagellar motor protein MotB [Acidobacteriota bacterium]|nr:flagellar motor protein MotB [Acidobacteriota bacterium]